MRRNPTALFTMRFLAAIGILLAGWFGSITVTAAQGTSSRVDLVSMLPAQSEIPDGLVQVDSQTRTLDQVVANYSDPNLAREQFTTWGWVGNAIRSFNLASGQEARSGVLNGVYVSIHAFDSPSHAETALDFLLTEQQIGQPLDEVDVGQLGDYTHGLYGLLDYGYETTIFVQQGNVVIRVSAAELDGDPTAKTRAIVSSMLTKGRQDPTSSSGTSSTSGTSSSSSTSSNPGWGASVMVRLCESPDGTDCTGVAGIVVNIYRASGELVGSCTTEEPIALPGGGALVSMCSVSGLPFNDDFVASQDLSTIPDGYTPDNNERTLHVESTQPGGGDEPSFFFSNFRTSDPASSTGTLFIDCDNFRACEGATLRVNTEAGETISTCTFPVRVQISSCQAPNVPRGIVVVFEISGLAEGYAADPGSLRFDTSDMTEPPTPGTYNGKNWEAGVQHAEITIVPSSSNAAPSETGTLSVVFWSPRDNLPWATGDCIQLKGATDLHCASDYPNGNVMINDIPPGTYEVCVMATGGEVFWGRNSAGPKEVTIVAGETLDIRINMYHKSNYDEGLLCGFD